MASPRGFWRGLLDAFAGWAVGLPGESCTYSITPVRIPLSDGVELAADLYQPVLTGDLPPAGQLLVHGPYGRKVNTAVIDASLWAARGYAVLFVSCRGTSGSGGQLDPARTEAADGQDIVAWMRKQPWYRGSFATSGASYLGYTQWALLHNPPPDLVAASISVGPHDYSRHNWGAGAFRLDRVTWSDVVSPQPGSGVWRSMVHMLTAASRLRPVLEGLPLVESVQTYFGPRAPWLTRSMMRPDIRDSYYEPMQHAEALERINVPVLLNTGWYDMFLGQTMEQYARLAERGCDVELTVGPWTHVPASGIKVMGDILQWMEEHVARRTKRGKKLPVRVFVTGAGEWRDLPRWPPPTSSSRLYLQSGHTLSKSEPQNDDPSSSFTYDPADPTPTVGGPLLTGGGRVDDTDFAQRADVLVFTTEPLDRDMEVLGKPSVELAYSSDNPHVDIFARLSEVDLKGRSHNVTETFKRLVLGVDPEAVNLEMPDCAHRFRKGTRVRLIIAGGCFPMFAKNLGTDENFTTAVTLRTATHTIFHGAGGLSSLVIPVAL